jgi:hypothetical protein
MRLITISGFISMMVRRKINRYIIIIKQGTTETIVPYLGISPIKLTSYSGTRYFKQRWMQPHLVIPYSKLDTTAL